jgi:hypothetical protein
VCVSFAAAQQHQSSVPAHSSAVLLPTSDNVVLGEPRMIFDCRCAREHTMQLRSSRYWKLLAMVLIVDGGLPTSVQ